MSITHKEFLRLLPKALDGLAFRHNDDVILVDDGERNIRIQLSEQSTRNIASLSLPVTVVRMQLSGFDQTERGSFLNRFDLAYQKGGG